MDINFIHGSADMGSILSSVILEKKRKEKYWGPWFSKIESFKEAFKSLCEHLKKMTNKQSQNLPAMNGSWRRIQEAHSPEAPALQK